MSHYVYFAGAVNLRTQSLDAIKIGNAINPKDRLMSISTHNHCKICLLSVISCDTKENALDLEKSLQKKFGRSRLSGEWFSITSELLFEVYQTLNHERVSITSLPKTRNVEMSEISMEIIEHLKVAGHTGLSAMEIINATGNQNDKTVYSALRRMLKKGMIHQPRKRGPYFYRAPNTN